MRISFVASPWAATAEVTRVALELIKGYYYFPDKCLLLLTITLKVMEVAAACWTFAIGRRDRILCEAKCNSAEVEAQLVSLILLQLVQRISSCSLPLSTFNIVGPLVLCDRFKERTLFIAPICAPVACHGLSRVVGPWPNSVHLPSLLMPHPSNSNSN